MSVFKIIREINENNPTLKQKLINIWKLMTYYYRLERGISNKSIFQSEEFNSKEDKKISNMLDSIDKIFIEQFLTDNIKLFLKKFELKNKIEFTEKKDFLQVGMNTVLIHEPFKGLWTTGKATFYLPISKKDNKLILEIFSVIPNTIIVGQDGNKLRTIPINKLQTKTIDLPLKNTENKVVEIFVDVEKRWRPNVITNKSNEIPMGVNIKSLMVN